MKTEKWKKDGCVFLLLMLNTLSCCCQFVVTNFLCLKWNLAEVICAPFNLKRKQWVTNLAIIIYVVCIKEIGEQERKVSMGNISEAAIFFLTLVVRTSATSFEKFLFLEKNILDNVIKLFNSFKIFFSLTFYRDVDETLLVVVSLLTSSYLQFI